MEKKTKFKITIITVVSVVVGLLYINRRQIFTDLAGVNSSKEWIKNEPTGQLVNGKRSGTWTIFYENGKLEREERYLNDTLHGPQFVYYPDGQLYIKRNYFYGKEIDSTIWYHSNGQKNSEEFSDSLGRKQGLFKIYYSNGQPSQVAYNKDGKLDGESRSYFDNGQLWEIKNYKLNERVGKWIEFSKSGDTLKVENY